MKMYWGVEVWFHTFLTSAPDGGEWSASCSSHFTHYPLNRRLGGPQKKAVTIRNTSHPKLDMACYYEIH
jgi:hypothetical protein